MARGSVPSVGRRMGSLPRRLTPFVGRQADLDVLLEILGDPAVRLVTILGVGGVGKTAVALELASRVQAGFQHGAVFVPLAQLNSVDQLLPTLADVLDVQAPSSTDLQQAVFDQLCALEILLVLDNLEHLLEGATLIRDILLAAPRVKILVTSREKLNLEADTLYSLAGLELPSSDDPQAIVQCDAVRLFLQRARQARPHFALNGGNAADIIRICQMVDGNPLGILLAASWIEHFSPAEIARQAAGNMDFLNHGLRDGEPRHSSLRAVFDYSFQRLDAQRQAIFRKLSVFRGGFDMAAAQAVAGADSGSLIALTEKSMLLRIPETGRYDVHAVLRQYAWQELSAAGELDDALAVHAKYYSQFVVQREPLFISEAQAPALDDMQADLENIRQAWSNIIERRDFEAVGAMLPGLYAFCDMRSRFHDGESLFRRAAEGLAPRAAEPANGAWALALLSWYDMHASIELPKSFEKITAKARTCLGQAIARQDAQATAASLVLLGAIAHHQGDFKTAIENYEDAIHYCPALDDVYWINMRIGLVYQADQQYDEAVRAFAGCLQRGQETGERVRMGWALQNMGDTLMLQDKIEEAQACLERAFESFLQVGTRTGMMWSSYSLSRAAYAMRKPDRARELAQTAAELARQTHSSAWIRKTSQLLEQLGVGSAQPAESAVENLHEPLSEREIEVLRLLKSELSGPDIAKQLVVSLNTVRFHTKQIYQKLGVNSRLEAIRRAKELGL